MMAAASMVVVLTGLAVWLRRFRILRVLVVAANLLLLGFCVDRLNHITRNAGANSASPPDLSRDEVYDALRQADAYARPYVAVVLAVAVCLAMLAALPVNERQPPPK
jgi:hypothetical protein